MNDVKTTSNVLSQHMHTNNLNYENEKQQLLQCQVCNEKVALYRCPACSTRSCSLKCCQQHKIQRVPPCNGKRDRTAFVPLNKFDDKTLTSDFHFLEDVIQLNNRVKRMGKDKDIHLSCSTSTRNPKFRENRNNPRKRGIHNVNDPGNHHDKEDEGMNKDGNNNEIVTDSTVTIQPLLQPNLVQPAESRTNISENKTPQDPSSPDIIPTNANTLSNPVLDSNDDASNAKKQKLEIDSQQEHESSSQNEPNNTSSILQIFNPKTSTSVHKTDNSKSMSMTPSNTKLNLSILKEDDWLNGHPSFQKRMVVEARKRGVNLLLMPPGMQRSKLNKKSTRYDAKKDCMFWRLEFIFHMFHHSNKTSPTSMKLDNVHGNRNNHESQKQSPEKISSSTITLTVNRAVETSSVHSLIADLLSKNISYANSSEKRSILKPYHHASVSKANNIDCTTSQQQKYQVLMKILPSKSNDPKYILMSDLDKSLSSFLDGKTIIEFPTFEIVLEKDLSHFPMIVNEV